MSSTLTIQSTLTVALTVALAGNPNSGKSTIFNALTGLRQKVGNYPGVTVEKKTGKCRLADGRTINVIDLPGTYSLISRSIDEQIAMEVLRGLRKDTPPPDVIIVVVDASNLQRNLYLVSQMIEVGRPMVVALNMIDIAERRGIFLDPSKLSEQLGVPVVPIVGHRKRGIEKLKSEIYNARIAPLPDWPLPEEMRASIRALEPELQDKAVAERLLIGDRAGDIAIFHDSEPTASILKREVDRLHAIGIDPMQADIEAHYKWIDGVVSASTRNTGYQPVPDDSHGLVAHDTKILDYESPKRHLTDKIDAILIHKVWGLLIFAVLMGIVFVSLFYLADPIMGWTEDGITHAGRFAAGFLPDGPIHDLWTDGIVAGVGAVVVFVPQIALLFLFLAIMEDSGYLARAAFMMDRLLSHVGLHGKSFIPLLSSFACAIPGIMATRTIENRRERLATIFVAPFMSCSARLPVYGLLIGAFFATFSAAARGGILLALYMLGILAAVVTAMLFRLGSKQRYAQTFILEMPSYKVPQISQVLRQVWTNSFAFIRKAGTIIFCLSVILWAMMYYPRLPEERSAEIDAAWQPDLSAIGHALTPEVAPGPSGALRHIGQAIIFSGSDAVATFARPDSTKLRVGTGSGEIIAGSLTDEEKERLDAFRNEEVQKAVAGEQLRQSIAGRIGHAIEPVIKPLGFDWKMGVGLVGAFAAREVFVSTMGIVYSVAGDDENTEPLAQSMLADTYPDGRRVWTPLVAVSLLAWFVIAMQCMSTLAIVKRELGGWKWPILMLLYMNALAYVVCLAIYQVGMIWFA